MSGRLTLALSEHIRSMTSWILTSHIVDLRKKESIDGSENITEETIENTRADEYTGAKIKVKETDVIPEGALFVEASRFQSNMVGSSIHDNLTSQTSETLTISSLPSVLSKLDVQPFLKEACEVHPNAHVYPKSVESEFPDPVMQANLGAALSSANRIQEEADNLDRLKLELIFRDSGRRELHTINEASLEKLDNLEPLSSCATLPKNVSHISLMNNSLAERSNITARSYMLAAGHDNVISLYKIIQILFNLCLSDTTYFFLRES